MLSNLANYDKQGQINYVVDWFEVVIKDERMACARLVETWADDHLTVSPSFKRMGQAIRNRGTR